MAVSNRSFMVDLDKPTAQLDLGAIGVGDNQSTEVDLGITKNNQPVSLAGSSVTVLSMLANRTTVPWNGSVSGNVVSVKIPKSALAIPGPAKMGIMVVKGSEVLTVAFVDYYAKRLSTDEVVDPGQVVPSIQELLAQIQRMETSASTAERVVDTFDDRVAQVYEDLGELQRRANAGEFNGTDGKDGRDGVARPEDVSAWLAAHPEATTTVQDGAVMMGKLHDDVLYNLRGKTVAPIYLGDYITGDVPSCCLKVDDCYYLFDGLNVAGHGDNNSTVYIYRNNRLINTVLAPIGHANSCCYDGQYIYVAPCNDYSGETIVGGQPILRFTKDMASYEIVRTPYSAPSVTYDPVAHQVYALCWKYDTAAGKHTNEYVYKINGTTCEYYAECELPWPIPSNEGQDFAVYDGHYVRSAAAGIVAIGALKKPTATVDSFVTVSTIDQNGRWKTGELEGMEFGDDGVLYATKYTKIGDEMYNGFLTALPILTDAKPPITASMVFSDAIFGVTLVTGNQTLAPSQTQIRSINQLNTLLPEISLIQVMQECTDGRVEIMEDIAIELYATLHMTSLYLAGGTCNISTGHSSNMLDIANHRIYLRRAAELGISGEFPLNVSGDRLDIDAGYAYCITRVRTIPSQPLYIGGVRATSIGLYTGAGRLARTNELPVIDRGTVSQRCEAGTNAYAVRVNFAKAFSGAPGITVSIMSETENPTGIEKIAYWISERSASGFVINIYCADLPFQRTPYFTWIAIA